VTNGTRVGLVAVALTVCGAGACKRQPVLRLTYEVDTAHAHGGVTDAGWIMATARSVVAHRLDELGARATVATRGRKVVVELAALPPDDLRVVKEVVGKSGWLELKMVDDRGSAALFGASKETAYPLDEGIEPYQEVAPDGLDEGGHKKTVKAAYARMTCKPPKHAGETTSECLARFEAWASTLAVPGDHQVGFESVSEAVAGTDPPRLEPVGWRTLYLFARAEVAGDAVADARVGREADLGRYYVSLTFGPAGARHFEELTSANVHRRMAIVFDGVVESAPLIRAAIPGGHAQVTMGAGDPETQLHDARRLELVVRSGALPAPLHLVSEEVLRKGG
jgi:preprotein translocase subunit SecD